MRKDEIVSKVPLSTRANATAPVPVSAEVWLLCQLAKRLTEIERKLDAILAEVRGPCSPGSGFNGG